MANLSDFSMNTQEQIEMSKPSGTQFRSKAVCKCGHSEGAHMGRRMGLIGPGEDCRIGKVECGCKKFIAVLEAESVIDFRARPGKTGAGHPLMQGIARLMKRLPEAEVRKLDGWVCNAPGCGSTGQLTPLYLEGAGAEAHPVAKDTGVTILVCATHLTGA